MSRPGKTLFSHARIATLVDGRADLGVIERGAILVEDGLIAAVGPQAEIDAAETADAQVIDLKGRWVTPGLIDCHTHIVHGGNRAREFEMRLEGATYEEIARAGGGILSSVQATRALSVDQLVQASLRRVDTLIAEGVTTIEIKSGYGLSIEGELRMLRAAREIGRRRPVRVLTSFLGAHATPPDYRGRNGDYVTDIVLPALEQAHAEGLVDAVDGFCEGIAFSIEDIRRLFDRAKALGLPVKLHAEQLSNLGGANLAASYGALSADHLEHLDADGAAAMGRAGTVAVLLPGAFYALSEHRGPPVALLRQAGVHMAVATDCNPGTSPLTSLLLAMNMASVLFRLTVREAIAGATREAARALGIIDRTGTIEVGKSADLAIWDVDSLAELVYRIGFNPIHAHYYRGERVGR